MEIYECLEASYSIALAQQCWAPDLHKSSV